MDESSNNQNRRNHRSNVLMSATLELSGAEMPVKLRNLSVEGALVEADRLPIEGSAVRFRKGDLDIAGRVVWVQGKRAGVAFGVHLEPEQLLRHVPTPRARVKLNFRRPGLASQALSVEERRFAEQWIWGSPLHRPAE